MNSHEKGQTQPSLTPSFPLASNATSRVMTQVESPDPHRGWHSRGYLPHWDHPGMIQSVNFRLGDSMPQSLLEGWRQELGIEARRPGAPASLPASSIANKPPHAGRDAGAPRIKTDAARKREVELRRRVEQYLDAGHGECWLRRPDVARLVETALLHFDGERYRLLAWCVMPNHVHTIIETKDGFPLGEVLHSWKSYTGSEANKLLRRPGTFWQHEYLDRYIRNAEHYEKVIAYIEENPVKARLAKLKTEWPWSSAKFRVPGSAGILPASC